MNDAHNCPNKVVYIRLSATDYFLRNYNAFSSIMLVKNLRYFASYDSGACKPR